MLRRAVVVAENVVVRIGLYFRRTFGRLFLALTAFEAGCLPDGRGFIPGDVAAFAFHAHRRIAGTRHKSRPHDDEEHHRKDCHCPGIHRRHRLNDGRNAARLHKARSEDFRRHDEKYP